MLRFRPRESAPSTPSSPLSLETVSASSRIEGHLDRVEARLGILPPDVRAEIRRELRQHVDALIAAHRELAPDEASEGEIETAALRQFGEPEQIAGRFVRAWKSTNREKLPGWAIGVGLLFHVECLLSFLYTVPAFLPNHTLHAFLTTLAPILLVVPPSVAAARIGRQKRNTPGLLTFYAIALFGLSIPLYRWGLARLSGDTGWPFHTDPSGPMPMDESFMWWLALGWGLAMVTHQIVSQRQRRAGRIIAGR